MRWKSNLNPIIMRQFQFTKGEIQVTVKVDLIDAQAQLFTIMQICGGKGNEFETIFPWRQGSVLLRSDLVGWFDNYSAAWTGIEYGGSEIINLNNPKDIKTLTITPTVTNGNKAKVKIVVRNSSNVVIDTKTIELTSGTNATVSVQMGFKYAFELTEGESWTSGTAPSEITVDGNESASLGITIPNTSDVYKMTLKPTITGAEKATITVTGTKEGYANDVHTVELAAADVEINVFDGYSYAFAIVTENGSWTSSTAPSAEAIDGANAEVAIAITVS